jgi:hypothetical protein
MDGIKANITGTQGIDNMLQGLSDIDQNKIIKAGLRAGVNMLKNAGKRRLRERMHNPAGVTGNLLSAFSVRVKKNKLGALAGFQMITENSSGEKIRVGHAYIVDSGTGERRRKNGGSSGVMPALKYWTDTKNQDTDRALEIVEESVVKAVTKMGGQ